MADHPHQFAEERMKWRNYTEEQKRTQPNECKHTQTYANAQIKIFIPIKRERERVCICDDDEADEAR